MAAPVTMPQLGESVTEGTIARWLKSEGDEVEKDEPLCEVDTDKVNAELPSPLAGRIEKLLVSEGTTVEVGTEIALVAGEAESPAADTPAREDISTEGPTEEFPAAGTEAQPALEGVERRRAVARVRSGGNGRGAIETAETLRLRRSSPVVRKLASEHGVSIEEVPGTGIGGRVTKKDIEGYIEEREAEREATPAATETVAGETSSGSASERERVPLYEGDRVVELTSLRRAIANRMSLSKREAPHAWTMVEADVTGLVSLRNRTKDEFVQREGVKLTYLPFIVRAVVEGLKEHPVLNSVWDGDRIVLRKRVNIGVAVDLEDALIVPVIPVADSLNVLGLARAIDDRVKRAREGKLEFGDVAGGTFTVNNPGSLGSVISTPIINYPQTAILSAEAVVERVMVVGGALEIRSIMNLDVSFDHRVMDGGVAIRFLNTVKRRLEGIGPQDRIG